jgi:hypothetical protein
MASENYLGNPRLKRADTKVEYTPEQVAEYIKCSEDPLHFILTYCKIVNIDKGLIMFPLWEFQKEMILAFEANRFVICKMPRQVGKTTTVAAYLLWKIVFNEEYSIAILANKDRQAREILGRIQLMFEHLPKWLQMGVTEWNKGNIKLENGSEILASATSSSAIRGTSQNMVYLDEFAFVPTNIQDEFFASVYPTISSGQSSKVLITSTPNGMNMFYRIWTESEEGRNAYARVDVHWSQIPGRDGAWREQTISNTSEDQFRQEYECEFLGSSNTLIHPTKLRNMVYKHPIAQADGGLKIYEEPEKDTIYAIVVDTARGAGADYSAFIVVNVSTMPYRQVAAFRNNLISPLIYPNIIYGAAVKYNDALVLVETNDIGQQVADILHYDLEYDGVLVTANNGRTGQSLSGGFATTTHYGVKTSKQVKRIGCATLKTLVESDKFLIYDYDTIYELSRFSLKNSLKGNQSYEAEDGNDDMAMCCVLFAWLTTQPYLKEITNVDIRMQIYEQNEKMLEQQMLPFGLLSTGDDIHDEEVNEPLFNNGSRDDFWVAQKRGFFEGNF